MARKRRTKYIWLPTLGADPNAGGGNQDLTESNGFGFAVDTDTSFTNQSGTIALFPVLEDTPQEQVTTGNPDPNIADFIGTDYVIKRIVGKCHLGVNVVAADTFPTVAVCAGFFVARCDDQNPLSPIGTNTTPQAVENYDPNYVDNIREPWIWRRTWILSNPATTNGDASEVAFANWPRTNSGYGSIQDGPHIDAKTGRRIRNDERLWFSCTARGITGSNVQMGPAPNIAVTVMGYLDVRVLGALRRARNRSNF